MSTRASPKPAAAKAAPKPTATKAPAARATAAAASKGLVSAPAPKPAATAPTKAPTPPAGGAAESPATKKTRQQLTNILHINISQARCATHLKQNLGDEETEAGIKALRAELKDTKDAGRVAEIKASIAALAKTLVRVSSDTSIATAVVCDILVKELLRRGMEQAIASDRKIVEVGHYHDGDPSSMLCYPLVSKLPSFAGFDPDHEEELRKKRAAANKAAKDAKEAKKAAEEKKPAPRVGGKAAAAKAAALAAEAAEEEEEEGEVAEHTKTTFFTYVENALKSVKKDPPYSTMRVSNRVREDLSTIVTEALARLATLSRIIVQGVMNVRTMNADHIKAVVRLLMVDEGRSDEQIAHVIDQIDDKVDMFHSHVKSEKIKKAAALDPDKKAEVENKKLEADLLRKKKQTELAKKRAIEQAQKAKTLTAEASALAPIVAANQAAAKAKAEATAVAKAEAAEGDAEATEGDAGAHPGDPANELELSDMEALLN